MEIKKVLSGSDKVLLDVFTPNKHLNSSIRNIILFIWLFILGAAWIYAKSTYVPHPMDVIVAMKDLIMDHGFLPQMLISTMLCLKAMGYSILISLFIAYSSRIAGFKPPTLLVAKARFLTTIGLTFLIAQITPDTASQKTVLLVFSISVFLVTSFMGVMATVTKDDLDYARTLKMNEWRAMLEVIVFGKADSMFECIRQNFGIAWMMLAMVENICRSDGGIGIILNDQNKHFHFDAVYGIQVMVLMVGVLMDQLFGWIKVFLFPYSQIKLQKS